MNFLRSKEYLRMFSITISIQIKRYQVIWREITWKLKDSERKGTIRSDSMETKENRTNSVCSFKLEILCQNSPTAMSHDWIELHFFVWGCSGLWVTSFYVFFIFVLFFINSYMSTIFTITPYLLPTKTHPEFSKLLL